MLEAISAVYQSEPVGYKEQPDFWNLVARLETELTPAALLAATHAIEYEMGRRPAFRNAPRVIDIDILLYGAEIITTPELVVPHPRLLERAFVLRPLVELDRELWHPGINQRLCEHLAQATNLERAEPIFPGARLLDGLS